MAEPEVSLGKEKENIKDSEEHDEKKHRRETENGANDDIKKEKERDEKLGKSVERESSKHRSRSRKHRSRSRSRDRGKDRKGSSKRSRSSRSRSRKKSRKSSKSRRHRSKSRSNSRSRTKPRSIKELREKREKRKGEKSLTSTIEEINSAVKKKTLFDVPPDPNAPVQPSNSVQNVNPIIPSATEDANNGWGNLPLNASNIIAPKFAKSVYVGGIDPSGTNEKELFDFFNNVINTVTGNQLNAVCSMYINKLKCFGFLEVNDYNLATAIIQRLNGIEYRGGSLSLRRPTNYDPLKAPPQGKLPDMDVTKVGLRPGKPSTYVENTPDKIYIAGIPFTVTDEQLQELLESFGPLESMCVVRERGYAFCQYKDKNVTDMACEGLNGMQLGTQSLIVKRADVNARFVSQTLQPEMSGAIGVPGVDPMAQQQMFGLQSLGMQNLSMPGSNHMASMAANGNYIVAGNAQTAVVRELKAPEASTSGSNTQLKPSRVLVLRNMVTEEELRDDREYEDIVYDVKNECSKFGRVKSVEIPRPNQSYHVPGLGKIFVQFSEEIDAVQAKGGLQGRTFGDRQVVCEFMDEEKFKRREY